MNLGNSEPRQVAGESSLQSGRRANKRRRNGHNDGVDDGPKYPPGRVAVPSFECPFCKDDPHRYAECRGYRLTRLSDVMQHISRQHRIGEVRLGFETLEEEDVVLYCARCRFLFRGRGASHRLDIHMNPEVECQPEPANIEQSGVMLPKEYEGLRDELRSYPRHDETFRWNIIWNWCFPGKPCPSSPYIEIILPRAEVQSIIQDELASMTGLSQEEAQSIARRSADRIYNTLSEPRSSPSVPPQAQSDSVQIAPVSNYHVPTYLASNPTLTSQPLQSQTQGYNSRPAQLGVYGMPTGGQRSNSFNWNNTLTNYSAPSPVRGSGVYASSGNNYAPTEYFTAHDSVYTHVPYVGGLNGSFQSPSQNDDYANTYGNDMGPRSSQD
ncbi:hypothetical protein FVEG_16682 [Fusarium verticillioides 7600]|uniref:C2H2-type domain-containing protein n=1 Tax=Gibberella moniliformis (strain M3125 / FGSC 7600) TaxID=334819 RepID=W7MIH9_GIBM7|nr:hypothetical protein FVEG_16682 [Fusarium verticillioides 7600]EWG50721.1 hypothetical protein FVEG_16682 [Fusarium verticillioides 7600]